jgi:hypothetical protein
MIEIGREIMTMIIIASVAFMALGKNRRFRDFTCFFIYVFGVWDIFYYVWLKVCLNWPASLFTWDVLFLLPVAWLGPVLSPMLVSIAMITAAVLWQTLNENEARKYPARIDYAGILVCCALILVTYVEHAGEIAGDFQSMRQGGKAEFVPRNYNWTLFIIAYTAGFIFILRPKINRLIKTFRK